MNVKELREAVASAWELAEEWEDQSLRLQSEAARADRTGPVGAAMAIDCRARSEVYQDACDRLRAIVDGLVIG